MNKNKKLQIQKKKLQYLTSLIEILKVETQ